MIVDGKALAQKLKEELIREVRKRSEKPRLVIISVGENPVSKRYLKIKKNLGEEIGVVVEEISLPEENAGDDIIAMIQHYSQKNTGIIIQLPLPEKFNAQKILNSIAPEYDPDMLSEASHEQFGRGESRITPPVVGAMKEILRAHAIVLKGKRAVVLGQGILVGKPVKVWLEREGALAHVVDIDTPHEERKKLLKNAGIIVSGAGTPHSICKEDVKEEVVILDAGTSEEGGALKGDVHPDVGEGASLFTPTPGGVGPLTSVMLFKNLIYLTR